MLILGKKNILAIFRIIFQKNWQFSDVIIPIAAILKKFFYHFFCNSGADRVLMKHVPVNQPS